MVLDEDIYQWIYLGHTSQVDPDIFEKARLWMEQCFGNENLISYDDGAIDYSSFRLKTSQAYILFIGPQENNMHVDKNTAKQIKLAQSLDKPVIILYKRLFDNTYQFYDAKPVLKEESGNAANWGTVSFGPIITSVTTVKLKKKHYLHVETVKEQEESADTTSAAKGAPIINRAPTKILSKQFDMDEELLLLRIRR